MNATHTDRPQKFAARHRRELPCHLAIAAGATRPAIITANA